MEDEIKGHWTFRECYDYLLRTGQIPYDEFAIDWSKELAIIEKVLLPKLNLKKFIIITSTPKERKGFFYNLWRKNND